MSRGPLSVNATAVTRALPAFSVATTRAPEPAPPPTTGGPAGVVRGLFALVGLAPLSTATGMPFEPLSAVLQLIYAAWRRIEYTLFNQTPTAGIPELDDQDLATGDITGKVVASDPDLEDAEHLTYTLVTPPAHGTVVVNPEDGTFLYKPDFAWAHNERGGLDSFTVQVSDAAQWHLHLFGAGDSVTVRVEMEVVEINRPPTITVDRSLPDLGDGSIDLTITASDEDLDDVTVIVLEQPAHGLLEFHGGDTYTYTPNFDYAHHNPGTSDSFTLLIDDGYVTPFEHVVDVPVTFVDRAPVVSLQTLQRDNLVTVFRPVITDADGDPAQIISVALPAGSGPLNRDLTTGDYTFVPSNELKGPQPPPDNIGFIDVTITYDDGFGNEKTAVVPLDYSKIRVFTVPFVFSSIVEIHPVPEPQEFQLVITTVDGTNIGPPTQIRIDWGDPDIEPVIAYDASNLEELLEQIKDLPVNEQRTVLKLYMKNQGTQTYTLVSTNEDVPPDVIDSPVLIFTLYDISG